ncbi:MAG: FKBP-type peptidyl-prolyl cis-trans isomerase [Chakrabartia sp.]
MTRLWAGLAVIALVAGGVAWQGTKAVVPSGCSAANMLGKGKQSKSPSGVLIEEVKAGSGASPTETDVALLNYRGSLADGTEFDAGQQAPFPVTRVIKGFSEALMMMQRGGSYHICIPSDLGYGAQSPTPKIPANAILIFDVDLLDFQSEAAVQAMQQQMQQQQGGPAGAVPGQPEIR